MDSTTESKIKLENKRGILKMFTLLSEYKTGGEAVITQYKEKENARSPLGCVCLQLTRDFVIHIIIYSNIFSL